MLSAVAREPAARSASPDAARRLLLLILIGALTAAAAAAQAAATKPVPTVVDARVGVHPDHTRIVLDLTARVPFRVQTLHAPERLVIDLPEVAWRARDPRPPAPERLIAGFRRGMFQPGIVRLVFDLRYPAVVTQTLQLPPRQYGFHRLVVDIARRPDSPPRIAAPERRVEPKAPELRPAPPSAARVRAAPSEPKPVPSGEEVAVATPERRQPAAPEVGPPKLKPLAALRMPTEKRIVVLDPGHGGRDGGAVGVTGTYEKDVVLTVAKELRDRLLASGRYDVVLTRAADTYVGLRDRLKVAREAGADAFISVHADSLDDHTLRGASVYTLSDKASDKEAEALARQHNKAEILNGLDLSAHDPEVQRILIDLARRDTNNKSIDLAGLVAAELAGVTTMLRGDRRHGGFVVLKSPDVPSVLVELGFMSNSVDEANLRDRAHRRGLADALLRALDRYFFGEQPS